MKEEKAGQAPEVEATAAGQAPAAAAATDNMNEAPPITGPGVKGERYHTAAREINRIKEIIGTQPESRYKSLAATAIEQAALWLDATVDENDHRRFALVATNAELAELWLIRS